MLEELGRAVAAVPFLTSAVVATTALLAAPRTPAADVALGRLAGGEATAALALPLSTAPGAAWPSAVRLDGDRLHGARDERRGRRGRRRGGRARGPRRRRRAGAGRRRVRGDAADVAGRDAPTRGPHVRRRPGDALAEGDAAVAAVRRALLTGAGLLASEQLGVAGWCLEETVAYLTVRRQFGRPVGSFQALKHRLADVWLEVTSLRAAARYAADRLARRAPPTTARPSSRSVSRRPTRPTSRYTPPRRRSSCTAASA